MKTRIVIEDKEAEQMIPPNGQDGSGIGVHYIDAIIKPLNTTTDDGVEIACKRKGLKLILSIGDQTGEAVIRRIDHGPDVRNMLQQALETAANEAGAQLSFEEGAIVLTS